MSHHSRLIYWFVYENYTGSVTDDSVEPSGTKKEGLNDKGKKDEEETLAPVYRAKSIPDSWVWDKQPGIFTERQAPKGQKHPPAGPALGPGHPAGAGCAERHAEDIEAKKEAQKENELDEQEANASTFHRSRTPLDKDLINTGICESSGKQCLPLVQLIQQLRRCEKRGPRSSRNLP
ncbi:E3 ubiquitin-protein ligase HERC2-like isoform X1 [Nomascus leucogenys]|uniref:E3 ubiquitin-protein ligase HERC2-like isoform X1 n=1 Tax=Nomascus leucogenys TaxID=61853 RepID=UPI00122DB350|nr:E3 ubiquitin-protein ligase HERC2-like isoform X1 [Nomascus leucogenys]